MIIYGGSSNSNNKNNNVISDDGYKTSSITAFDFIHPRTVAVKTTAAPASLRELTSENCVFLEKQLGLKLKKRRRDY